MNRKTIVSITGGIIFLIIAIFLFRTLSTGKKSPDRVNKINYRTVSTKQVKYSQHISMVQATGQIMSKNKIELFAEVSGVFEPGDHPFKKGQKFRRGDLLVNINKAEIDANLRAQRSSFQSLIVKVMADLQLDFPERYSVWDDYLNTIKPEDILPELPNMTDKKELYFISNRNIISTYYNIKNTEARYIKYEIEAPYDGTLSEAFLNPGSLVRAGQKLGEFLNDYDYELELNVKLSDLKFIQVNNKVIAHSESLNKDFEGKILRINSKVDRGSNMISVIVGLKSNELKDGMFMTASINGKILDNVMEIPRSYLKQNDSILIVRNDSTIQTVKIEPLKFNKETVLIQGLPESTKIVNQSIQGAYNGMKVKLSN